MTYQDAIETIIAAARDYAEMLACDYDVNNQRGLKEAEEIWQAIERYKQG